MFKGSDNVSKLEKGQRKRMDKRLLIISIILINIFIGFGMIIPVIPVMVQDVGAAPFHLGMLLAIYSAASFFVSPMWGALADRIGRRPVIMIGLFGFSISFFLFGIGAESLTIMYISRFLGGIFSGAATSSAIAYIADITTEEERTKAMGLAGASIGLGFIFGPAFGGLLSYFGNEVPFYVSALLTLFAMWYTRKYLAESLTAEKRSKAGAPKESRWKAFAGALKYLYVMAFFVTFTLAVLESTLQYFEMEVISATTTEIGWMFAIVGVVGALIQGGVVRRYAKGGTEGRFILVGLLLSAIGFYLITLSNSFWTATLFISVFSAGNALIRPCVQSLITQKTTVGQGVASGLISSMDSLGRIIGPLFGTGIYAYGIKLPFYWGAIFSLAAVLLVFGFYAADRRRSGLGSVSR